MAFAHGSKADIYVNGYDVTGYLRSVKAPMKATTAEVTNFNSNGAKQYIPGIYESVVTAEGFFDPATGAEDALFGPALASGTVVWSWYPAGDGVGNWGYGFQTVESSYDIGTTVAEAATVTVEGVSSTGRERILNLHPKQAESGNGNGSSVDNLALTSNGYAAYYQNFGGGAQNATVKVQHATDNSTWVDLDALVLTAGAIGATRVKSAAGVTVNRYLRALWTSAGGTNAFSLSLVRY